MATIANQYDPNNPNAASNQGGGGTVMPSTGGGGGGASTTGAGGSQASATPYQPPNVSQYLAANPGAGQRLTTGITGNIQNQANQLGQQVNTSQNQANAQYQPLNQNLSQGQQVAQTAFQNPQALLDSYNASKTQSNNQPLSSDQQINAGLYNQFQQLNTGGYNQGIQNYGNYTKQQENALQGQLGNLTQQTGSANTEMGRAQLLQNAVGQGNYNPGEQTLDALFLQAPSQRNAGGLSNLQQLQQNLKGIGNQASQQVGAFGTDAQSKLAALQSLSAGDQAGIKNLFNTGSWTGQAPAAGGPQGIQGIAGNVQNEYNALQQNAAASNAAWQNAAQGNYSPEVLAALGLQPGSQTWGLTGQQLEQAAGYQANPLAGFNQGGAALAATPEEFARYNALNQLAGGPAGQVQPSIFGTASQAGGYNPYTLTNAQGAQNAIQQNAQKYGVTNVNNIIDQMRQAGYFGQTEGAHMGGGVGSAANPGEVYRQRTGDLLSQLQQNAGTANPNDYYNQVLNAVNQGWAGSGANLRASGSPYQQLFDYANTLNPLLNAHANIPENT